MVDAQQKSMHVEGRSLCQTTQIAEKPAAQIFDKILYSLIIILQHYKILFFNSCILRFT